MDQSQLCSFVLFIRFIYLCIKVLIISYDLFRMNSTLLSQSKNIGLLVVDEGHRLKNTSGSLTLSALETLNCKARLVITGTPVQNNLSEFYNVANFACAGILGDLNTFRRGMYIALHCVCMLLFLFLFSLESCTL